MYSTRVPHSQIQTFQGFPGTRLGEWIISSRSGHQTVPEAYYDGQRRKYDVSFVVVVLTHHTVSGMPGVLVCINDGPGNIFVKRLLETTFINFRIHVLLEPRNRF